MSVVRENLSIVGSGSSEPGKDWVASESGPGLQPGPRELLAKTPPSGRDFEVYAAIVGDGGTTRSAAYEFGISQTRVMQVKNRVKRWMQEVELDADDAEPTPRQLQLARALAADRFEHLYSQAMVGWNSSSGEVERIRATSSGDEVITTTTSYGDCRYLLAAARLALLQSKVGSAGILTQAWAKAGDALETQGVDIDKIEPPRLRPGFVPEDAAEAGPAAPAPSEEDCSDPLESEPRSFPDPRNERDEIRVLARRLDRRERKQQAARETFFAPVQAAPLGDLARSVLPGVQAAETPSGRAARPHECGHTP